MSPLGPEEHEELLRKLAIRVPRSSHPISFSSYDTLDYHVGEILRSNLARRDYDVGVGSDAQELIAEVLEQREDLEDDDRIRARDAFIERFEVHGLESDATEDWSFDSGNIVRCKARSLGTPSSADVAVYRPKRLAAGTRAIELQVNVDFIGDVGLVFNHTGDDFWAVRCTRTAAEEPIVLAVLRSSGGTLTVVESSSVVLAASDSILTIAVRQGAATDQLVASIVDKRQEFGALTISGQPLLADSGVGFLARPMADILFHQLHVVMADDISVFWLPETHRALWRLGTSEHIEDMGRARFLEDFAIVELGEQQPEGARDWRYGAGGIVEYTGTRPVAPTIALSSLRVGAPTGRFRVFLHVHIGNRKTRAGLVFNYVNAQNYTCIRYQGQGPNASVEPTLELVRVEAGTETVVLSKPVPPLNGRLLVFMLVHEQRIRIDAISPDPSVARRTLWFTRHQVDRASAGKVSLAIQQGTKIGLYASIHFPATFTSLYLKDGALQRSLPDQLADTVHHYLHHFRYDVIDTRPVEWLTTMRYLFEMRKLARKRYELANNAYNTGMAQNDEFMDVDELEEQLQRAFFARQEAEGQYDEFASFLVGNRIAIRETGNPEQPIAFLVPGQSVQVKTSRDFYIDYAVYAVLPGEHLEKVSRRQRLGRFRSRVSHETYLATGLGLVGVNGSLVVMAENKYEHRRRDDIPAQEEYRSLEITDSQSLREQLQRLMEKEIAAPGIIESQPQVRQYHYAEGHYLDDYGIPLEQHVMEITRAADPTRSHVLFVPYVGEDGEEESQRQIMIRNPRFSGACLHPITIRFEERFVLEVGWRGIGLGELSHSVSLFPGEERQLTIVTRKQRTWREESTTQVKSKSKSSKQSATASVQASDFSTQLQSSLENSTSVSTSRSTTKKSHAEASASGGWGPFSASVSAGASRKSKSKKKKSASSVAKSVSDVASRTSSEVSTRNKISISSEDESASSSRSVAAGRDTESQTQEIVLSNINEGRTVNYDFFQLTNVYGTTLRMVDVKVEVDTGIEIIPGLGLTIARQYDIEDIGRLIHDLTVYAPADRAQITRAITAHIVTHYLRVVGLDGEPGSGSDDEPRIVRLRDTAARWSDERIQALRTECEAIVYDPDAFTSSGQDVGGFVQPLPDELADFLHDNRLVVSSQVLSDQDSYTVNSGSFYVDTQIGVMPATEAYLEERRGIETDRQRAQVEELRARTAAGVFFANLPETVNNLDLSVDGETRTNAPETTEPGGDSSV